MTLGQVWSFDPLTIKPLKSKKNNKSRRRIEVKSPDWPLMPGQRPPSRFAFFSTTDSPGEKNTFLEPPTKSTPPKKKAQKIDNKSKDWQLLGSLPYIGPGTSAVRPSFLAFSLSVLAPVTGAAAVIRVLYGSFIVIPGVPYMTHLLPKVSARFVHHWPSSA